MKSGFTAALMLVAAMSLVGCDEKTKVKKLETAEIKGGRPFLLHFIVKSWVEKKNYRKAFDFYKREGAAYNLGVMYVNGFGVPKDYLRAYMWWSIAASSGDKDAITYLGLISNRMTPTQLSQADELVRKCQANNYQKCD